MLRPVDARMDCPVPAPATLAWIAAAASGGTLPPPGARLLHSTSAAAVWLQPLQRLTPAAQPVMVM